METAFIQKQLKKVCIKNDNILSLVEAASHKMVLFGFIIDCSITSQILRGNTKAFHKLLLHASTSDSKSVSKKSQANMWGQVWTPVQYC